MKPGKHIIVSLAVGVALAFWVKSLYAGIICFLAGVLADIDHIIDYLIHHGKKDFSLRKVYEASVQTARQEGEKRFSRLYLIFHVNEISILLWVIYIYTKNIYILAVALGYSLHLIMDCINNPMYPYSYFLIWRLVKNFKVEKLFKKNFKQNC